MSKFPHGIPQWIPGTRTKFTLNGCSTGTTSSRSCSSMSRLTTPQASPGTLVAATLCQTWRLLQLTAVFLPLLLVSLWVSLLIVFLVGIELLSVRCVLDSGIVLRYFEVWGDRSSNTCCTIYLDIWLFIFLFVSIFAVYELQEISKFQY